MPKSQPVSVSTSPVFYWVPTTWLYTEAWSAIRGRESTIRSYAYGSPPIWLCWGQHAGDSSVGEGKGVRGGNDGAESA